MLTGQLITIPFQDKWKDKILKGEKVCTTRTKVYGKKGDGFILYDKTWVLRQVEEVTLDMVACLLYKAEGCSNAGEFVGVWNTLHPIKGYRPSQRVFLHWFEPNTNEYKHLG